MTVNLGDFAYAVRPTVSSNELTTGVPVDRSGPARDALDAAARRLRRLMPWLEVPEWRAFEPYAGLMTDTPNTPEPEAHEIELTEIAADEVRPDAIITPTPEDTPDDEQTVVTGEMHIVLDEVQLADLMAGNNDE